MIALVFLLTKSERYFWDVAAMQEPAVGALPGNVTHKHTAEYEASGDEKHRTKAGLVAYAQRQRRKRDSTNASAVPGASAHGGIHREGTECEPETRNRRSVWTVATRPFKGAHFATYPPALIEPCIAAGSRRGSLVLDPFGGAGTTGVVAARLGRRAVLCEVNPDYAAMAERRIAASVFGAVAFGSLDG